MKHKTAYMMAQNGIITFFTLKDGMPYISPKHVMWFAQRRPDTYDVDFVRDNADIIAEILVNILGREFANNFN